MVKPYPTREFDLRLNATERRMGMVAEKGAGFELDY
jgi:hypothetical protein